MLKLIDSQVLSDIADAIRHCNETDERYHPSEMADAIFALAMFGAPIPIYGLFDVQTDTEVTARSLPDAGTARAISESTFQDIYDISATASLRS